MNQPRKNTELIAVVNLDGTLTIIGANELIFHCFSKANAMTPNGHENIEHVKDFALSEASSYSARSHAGDVQ